MVVLYNGGRIQNQLSVYVLLPSAPFLLYGLVSLYLHQLTIND